MKYSLNSGEWNSVFAVPSSVVDKYIKLAGKDALKLVLFLLRHGGESFSDEYIAEALGFHDTGELEDAAEFWIQRGVVFREGGEESGALLPAREKDTALPEPVPEKPESPPEKPVRQNARLVGAGGSVIYTAGDIAERKRTDPSIDYLFSEAEKIYKKQLNPNDMRNVIALVDTYGLPAPVAVMLLDYCFRIKKTSARYIHSVAGEWSEAEINTVELADERIKKLERRDGVEKKLAEAMEMKSKFTPEQRGYIRVWTEEWGFGEDMIMLAYDITVNRISTMSFPYCNTILDNWFKEGIFTTEAAAQENASRKKSYKKNGAPAEGGSSSFDVDDVLAQIRSRYQNT